MSMLLEVMDYMWNATVMMYLSRYTLRSDSIWNSYKSYNVGQSYNLSYFLSNYRVLLIVLFISIKIVVLLLEENLDKIE